jgi:hypothetical protein
MGQYWKAVNLTKREWIDAHQMGSGVKLWEQLANDHTGRALVILCAAMPEARGGGDLDVDQNYHGSDRDMANRKHAIDGAPVVEEYNDIAKRTIGRWAGDQIALVGDYAADGDLSAEHRASTIYGRCVRKGEEAETFAEMQGENIDLPLFTDVTPDVMRVIEHELGGKFKKDPKYGWPTWVLDRAA